MPRDIDSAALEKGAYVKHADDAAHSRMMTEIWNDMKFRTANGAADMATFAATTFLTRRLPGMAAVGTGMWGGAIMKPAVMAVLDYEDMDLKRDVFTGMAAGIMGPGGRAMGASASRQIEDLPLLRMGRMFAERAPGALTGAVEGLSVGYVSGFNAKYAFERHKGLDADTARSHAIEAGVKGLPTFTIAGAAAGAAMKGSIFQFSRVVRGY